MAKVIHVLADGRRVDDINGRVILMTEIPELYRALDNIASRREIEPRVQRM